MKTPEPSQIRNRCDKRLNWMHRLVRPNFFYFGIMKTYTKAETARILLMHSVHSVLEGCGNSYVNSYTESWLRAAKELGAYHGPVVGRILDVKQGWEEWMDEHGLPDIPSA